MKKKILIPIILLTVVCFYFFSNCNSINTNFKPSSAKSISHELFEELLVANVTDKGNVNYQNFIKEKKKFIQYLDLLSDNAPSPKWSKNQKLAYWINAYNAFTIKLIIDNYPVKSITDLHPPMSIGLINGIWHKKFFRIGGQEMNLNAIEHQILRKDFEEPRIHFAIVCASKSCPKLLNHAFVADKIEEQLMQQAKAFLADDFRNKIKKEKIELSKIFSWFKGDFTKKSNLITFLNQYSPTPIDKNASISYLDYDWSLNE